MSALSVEPGFWFGKRWALSRTGADISRLSAIHFSMYEHGLDPSSFSGMPSMRTLLWWLLHSRSSTLLAKLSAFFSSLATVAYSLLMVSSTAEMHCSALEVRPLHSLMSDCTFLIAANTPSISVWKSCLNDSIAFMMSEVEGFSVLSMESVLPTCAGGASLFSSELAVDMFSSLRSPPFHFSSSLFFVLVMFDCSSLNHKIFYF